MIATSNFFVTHSCNVFEASALELLLKISRRKHGKVPVRMPKSPFVVSIRVKTTIRSSAGIFIGVVLVPLIRSTKR